ncbi:hypothetical protein, variant [Verruconis gallopava]|uniref:Cns1/TTC4 wheel domain-containing protein n=1 Tax=Verruconis gallopava TaxID=253628 RepID=A0A0D1XSD6_9PEZI|nr:uncharacterized protein PV09_03534 [Verruconis gallopava]XP_016215540.1 hypothetical protein, variant [Verruconis gallopava]KIW05670.1 hypothetical protein PV09_03534 [Verruconis gallopava]KIW05671.1 hypothetical protein, variant [Verruconis gallopava]
MSRIEELPDDFDERIDLNKQAPAQHVSSDSSQAPDLVDHLLHTAPPFPSEQSSSQNNEAAASASGPSMPPAMHSIRKYTADEVVKMLNRTPLFMTTLDETDGEGGENIELEALRALAYEGTRAEVAQNFREQGNEQARAKHWRDAKGYYDQAIAALKNPNVKPRDPEEGAAQLDVVELDEEKERAKEREIEEACYINRALCNLELKNYRACTLDCAATLKLNPDNVKAWYRSASACLALDKIPEAEDACARGLEVDRTNAALKTLQGKILARKNHLAELERKRREREERAAAEKAILSKGLKARGIKSRTTDAAPDTEDAVLRLSSPLDPSSTLVVPVLLLYPLHAQSDFIKAFEETQTLNDHLEYILPLPWDAENEYTPEVECYIESAGGGGGLIKAGKKLPLHKILGSGKVEIVDGLLRVYVVPKARSESWVREFKARQPQKQ